MNIASIAFVSTAYIRRVGAVFQWVGVVLSSTPTGGANMLCTVLVVARDDGDRRYTVIPCAGRVVADRKKSEKLSRSDIRQIRTRIDVARKYYMQCWDQRDQRHAKLYKGDFIQELPVTLQDSVNMNYLKRLVKMKVSGLAAEAPILRFRPRGGGKVPFGIREAMARVWEAYIPYVWREANIHPHARAALKDKYIFARGWVGIDWKTETQDLVYDGDRPETMPKEEVLYDNPVVRRIPPNKFLIDPQVDTLTWEDAQYVVWQMSWPVERIRRWAKSDKRVKDDVAQRINGDETLEKQLIPTELDPKTGVGLDKQFRRATIYRYHEHDRNIVVYLAKELQDDFLLAIENPYDLEGYPFESIWADGVPDKMDAIGLVEDMRHWQRIFNLVRSKQAGMIRTAKHIIGVQGAKDEDIQAMESGEERTIIPIDIGAQMPREAVTTGFPPELVQFENVMRVDYTELSGVNAMRRGIPDPGIGTATETSMLVQQSQVGDQDEQADWEDFNARIGRKVKALIEQFGDRERIAAVSPEAAAGLTGSIQGPDGKPIVDVQHTPRYTWARFTPQEIADDHEIDVVVGSMNARAEAVERAQFIEGVKGAVEVATAAAALQAVGLNPAEVAKEIFRRTGNIDTERFFGPPAGQQGNPFPMPGTTPPGAPPGTPPVPQEPNRVGAAVGATPTSQAQLLQRIIGGAVNPNSTP